MPWRTAADLTSFRMEVPATERLRNPDAVASAVAAWAATTFGGTVTVAAAETISGGFDNYVHGFQMQGGSLPDAWKAQLVIRIAPAADRLPFVRTEMAIQNWVVAQTFPAATV